jgi:putative membrane protein
LAGRDAFGKPRNSFPAPPLFDQATGVEAGLYRKDPKMSVKYLLAGVAAIALTAQPALAQNAPQPTVQADQTQLADVDLDFATEAAQGGLFEVRLGELAAQRSQNPEVQEFGKRMAVDHGQANDTLMEIAGQKGIELPQTLSDDAQETYEDFQERSGEDFDEAYMDEMVSDHEDDVDAFESYVEDAEDSELRSFAEQTLPTLKEHLQLARQTQERVESGAAQGWVSIDEALGSSVVNANGDEVGEIQDVVMKDDAYFAVVEVGGFLGLGEKDVAVPLDELKLGEDQSYLMSKQTEDQLEQMPAYEATQYQPYQR